MNPIEEIDRLAELRLKEIADLKTKAEALPEKIASANDKASAAVNANDLGAFEAATVEREELRREEDFVQKRLNVLNAAPTVDADRVVAAWNDYRSKYDPQMEKGIAEFAKAKQKMLDAYSAMVKLQTESSEIRKRLGSYVGAGAVSLTSRFPAKMIPLRSAAIKNVGFLSMGGTTLKDPDAVYYLSDYIINENETKAGYFVHNDRQLVKLNGIIGAGMIPD